MSGVVLNKLVGFNLTFRSSSSGESWILMLQAAQVLMMRIYSICVTHVKELNIN